MSVVRAPHTPPPSPSVAGHDRVVADKWFRDDAGAKFFWHGITYGPFKPNSRHEPWPEDEQLVADFRHIASLGCNVVRIYEPPTDRVLQTCAASGLRLLAGAPWTQHVDFCSDRTIQRDALGRVTRLARRLAREPCVAGLLIGNEIEKNLVRWMAPERVRSFLEQLIDAAKAEAPDLPVAYANYPSTEYLAPRNADFIAFNVFLEKREDFVRYIRHLQVIANERPLVISEFGFDSRQHGETAQAEVMRWQREALRNAGVAGGFWFSYTDEWHRGGEQVTNWEFGIVTRERKPKRACVTFSELPTSDFRLPTSGISAIVCTRNGAATLGECLSALGRQSHPNFEVLVIDDGSTDATPSIAQAFPFVKYHRQEHAGLSAARNFGARLSREAIVCFTDDDCIPDEDWLLHLAAALEDESCVAAGGPNLPPAPRTATEAVVAAAPGAPSHVLASDGEAEHLPGCNLAIRRSALESAGGFREEFTVAGDDVDICWQLQAGGGKLCFVPTAVVWHHRRPTVAAYLRQQRGYGFAEALLIKRWPERFAWIGGARWRGAIYGHTAPDDLSEKVIDYGIFGSALFPTIYDSRERRWSDAFPGLPILALVVLLLVAGVFFKSVLFPAILLFVVSLAAAGAIAVRRLRGLRSHTWRDQGLLAALCWLQPLVRDGARMRGIFALRAWPQARVFGNGKSPGRERQPGPFGSHTWCFWNRAAEDDSVFREALAQVCQGAGKSYVPVTGPGSLWDLKMKTAGVSVFLSSVTEYHEDRGRLVRVRCSRPQWSHAMEWLWLLPVALGVLGALVLPGTAAARSFRMDVGILVQLGTVMLGTLWDVMATRRLHSLVSQAAERCGWLEKGNPHQSQDSGLATLSASDKLPEHAP